MSNFDLDFHVELYLGNVLKGSPDGGSWISFLQNLYKYKKKFHPKTF